MLAQIMVGLVGLLHAYFLILEMFLWEKPIGLKTFANSKERASSTKVLAANQGLYNGFLAAGLFWGLIQGNTGVDVQVFFLACVMVAGIYGAVSVSKKILYVQAVPAFIGLAFIFFDI